MSHLDITTLPADLIVTHVLPYLAPKDHLALAMSTKQLYKTLPRPPLSSFSHKWAIGQCLREMSTFIYKNRSQMARWTFYNPIRKQEFTLYRKSKSHGSHGPPPLADFETHMLPYLDHLQLHTACWYKSPAHRKRYAALTDRMWCLLYPVMRR